jgi:hypothetical protein
MDDLTNVEAIEHASLREWNMPYSDAKEILKEKFNATEQEIVRWMLDKEITPKGMWGTITVGGKDREVCMHGIEHYEHDGKMHRLQSLYFNSDKINRFVPQNRWTTFNQVMERWPESDEGLRMRQLCVAEKLKINDLPFPKESDIDNAENLSLYVYHLSDIESIFPLRNSQKLSTEPQAETVEINNAVIQVATVSVSERYAKTVDGGEGKTKDNRESQLHALIWRVYQSLVSKHGRATAQKVWNEIKSNYKEYDSDEIIQEVTAKRIFWVSVHGNEQTFAHTSIDSLLCRLKKEPPI